MNNYLRQKIMQANMKHSQSDHAYDRNYDRRGGDYAFDPYTGRDRNYDRNQTLAGRDLGNGNYEIRGSYDNRSGYDNRDMRDRGYDNRDMRDMRDQRDMRDMNYDRRDQNYDRNYDRQDRRDMNYDRNYDRQDMMYNGYQNHRDFEYNYDLHDMPLELHKKDIKQWEQKLENEDGSHGMKFTKEQLIPMAQQKGIKFDKFNEDEFVMAVNMLYSDFCEAFKESRVPNYTSPELYINMAKYFFCDKDFKGQPYEKLALYYHGIVDYN